MWLLAEGAPHDVRADERVEVLYRTSPNVPYLVAGDPVSPAVWAARCTCAVAAWGSVPRAGRRDVLRAQYAQWVRVEDYLIGVGSQSWRCCRSRSP